LRGLIAFIVIYFSIYGGVHYYAFVKLKRGLGFNTWIGVAVALFMGLMILAPVLMRMGERNGHDYLATGLAYVGFFWMGFVFLFISSAFGFDIYRGFLAIIRFITQKYLLAVTPTDAFSCMASMLIACLVMAYGFVEANTIRLESVVIRTAKLPENVDPIRIAQISDVHLGLVVGENRLRRIRDQINKAKPHVLVSTGDLVDGKMIDSDRLATMLRSIQTPLGKYAVTGNHEFYAGLQAALDFTLKAGFVYLRGQTHRLPNGITIAGVDDPTGRFQPPPEALPEHRLLSDLPDDQFTVLLKHQPVVAANSLGHFDLQLSGHTHNGQIFPFGLLVKLAYKINSGFTNLGKGSAVYVSRGTGTWGPPVRFLAPPEVTLIEIIGTQS